MHVEIFDRAATLPSVLIRSRVALADYSVPIKVCQQLHRISQSSEIFLHPATSVKDFDLKKGNLASWMFYIPNAKGKIGAAVFGNEMLDQLTADPNYVIPLGSWAINWYRGTIDLYQVVAEPTPIPIANVVIEHIHFSAVADPKHLDYLQWKGETTLRHGGKLRVEYNGLRDTIFFKLDTTSMQTEASIELARQEIVQAQALMDVLKTVAFASFNEALNIILDRVAAHKQEAK